MLQRFPFNPSHLDLDQDEKEEEKLKPEAKDEDYEAEDQGVRVVEVPCMLGMLD